MATISSKRLQSIVNSVHDQLKIQYGPFFDTAPHIHSITVEQIRDNYIFGVYSLLTRFELSYENTETIRMHIARCSHDLKRELNLCL